MAMVCQLPTPTPTLPLAGGGSYDRASLSRVAPVTDAVARLAPLPGVAPRFDAKWLLIGVARRAGRLARARAARLPAVAELPHAADRERAGAIHAGEFPHRLSQRGQRAALFQLAAVRGRRRRARARRRHRARLDERAHQHAVQDAVLRARDHSAGHPRHPVHGVVDHAGEPEDRPDQSRPAEAHRHRRRVRRTSTPWRA